MMRPNRSSRSIGWCEVSPCLLASTAGALETPQPLLFPCLFKTRHFPLRLQCFYLLVHLSINLLFRFAHIVKCQPDMDLVLLVGFVETEVVDS